MPLLKKGILERFKIEGFSRGRLYGSGNNDDFTLIHTGVGPCFTGDAVLHLKETPCRKILLFGSCGLVRENDGLSVGSLVSPGKCYSQESFTELLLGKNKRPGIFYPQKKTFGDLLHAGEKYGVRKVICSTIASLKLEEGMVDACIEKGVDVVDMECSAFFSAAGASGLKAAAVFFVSDVINKKPFYVALEQGLQSVVSASIMHAADLICECIKKNQNG
jgi:purine-nucleoside phosphorylase